MLTSNAERRWLELAIIALSEDSRGKRFIPCFICLACGEVAHPVHTLVQLYALSCRYNAQHARFIRFWLDAQTTSGEKLVYH